MESDDKKGHAFIAFARCSCGLENSPVTDMDAVKLKYNVMALLS